MSGVDREAAFLTGKAIAELRGDASEWRSAARSYLTKSIAGASGAATVRVSVAALELVLRASP